MYILLRSEIALPSSWILIFSPHIESVVRVLLLMATKMLDISKLINNTTKTVVMSS